MMIEGSGAIQPQGAFADQFGVFIAPGEGNQKIGEVEKNTKSIRSVITIPVIWGPGSRRLEYELDNFLGISSEVHYSPKKSLATFQKNAVAVIYSPFNKQKIPKGVGVIFKIKNVHTGKELALPLPLLEKTKPQAH